MGFKNLGFRVFYKCKKNLKSKSPNFRSFIFFSCVTNLIQMIFKYELRFVAFTWPNLCFWVVILCQTFVTYT